MEYNGFWAVLYIIIFLAVVYAASLVLDQLRILLWNGIEQIDMRFRKS